MQPTDKARTLAYVDRIADRIRAVEADVARDARAQQRRWHYQIHRRRVWFDREARKAHRQFRQSIPSFLRQGSVANLLTAPIIYTLILPLAVLDLWVTLYQWICFPIYGIGRVPRRAYFVIDRYTLAYLNGIEKINCTFCSYANGLLAYVLEVAARTEQYWCPIKHARAVRSAHPRYHRFFDFGDASAYRSGLNAARRELSGRHRRRRSPGR
jgi:hypothetical protein